MQRLRHRWSYWDYRILPLPQQYPAPLPVPSLAVSLTGSIVNHGISSRTYQTSYEHFKPNKNGYHLQRRYYRLPCQWQILLPLAWRLAPVLPTAYSLSYLDSTKVPSVRGNTLNPSITLACIVEFSRLLRTVVPGFLSQNPSPGFLSQGPYGL